MFALVGKAKTESESPLTAEIVYEHRSDGLMINYQFVLLTEEISSSSYWHSFFFSRQLAGGYLLQWGTTIIGQLNNVGTRSVNTRKSPAVRLSCTLKLSLNAAGGCWRTVEHGANTQRSCSRKYTHLVQSTGDTADCYLQKVIDWLCTRTSYNPTSKILKHAFRHHLRISCLF